ncbi:uncharacterized protein A1O9_05436 [Exophiala aquamarina CBS 119918]|uniref:Uncharacterized protein n=1 Tax=Exophiala aquamarina CBS 119918 TaxID=1182545 RepID=A0A072PBN3_9EURO|nr:uncharacterized protein A1O9_05436 [Exophiala aquamarina CBS 119918]KEF57519.1 hypothetical protein A1O9_05436 [Exophiala aquamarina CBS 119918]
MTDAPNPLGPQPNLVNLSQGLRTAADEAEKLQNLPAFRDGDAIVAAIQDLHQQFQIQFQNLNNQFQNLNNQFQVFSQQLRTQLQASELNNMARIQNSHSATQLSPLTPLVNNLTAAQVPSFPATSRQIARMEGPELDAVIQDLGVGPAAESVASKRRQLRGLVGLEAQPETP